MSETFDSSAETYAQHVPSSVQPRRSSLGTERIFGTIFDPSRQGDPVALHRRCGLLYVHNINPGAVMRDRTTVEDLGDGQVRVHYEAVYLPPHRQQFPFSKDGVALPIPRGVTCEHGGERHTVVQVKHFDTSLEEVL